MHLLVFLTVAVGIVLVPLSLPTAPPAPSSTAPMDEFRTLKYGAFVHYVWGGSTAATRTADGSLPTGLDHLADSFDAIGFANDLQAWGVQYVILTAWHANINPLYPSQALVKWGLDKHVPRRDVLGDAIRACRKKNILVFLYTHPRDGHDLQGGEQKQTGWVPGDGANPDWSKWDRNKWNDFTNDLYSELVTRYGGEISGLYLDEGSVAGDSDRVVDYARLRATIKLHHPRLIMIQNFYGNLYSCDVGDIEHGGDWQSFGTTDGDQWPAAAKPQAVVFASDWWASKPVDHPATRFSPEAMFPFTVPQAGANPDGGGTQWAAGPYAGGGWEAGVNGVMRKLGAMIADVAPSIKGTVASRSFPTAAGTKIIDLAWGVATSSPDGQYEYLHILKPPAPGGKCLTIGVPRDGRTFAAACLWPGRQPVQLASGPGGLQLTLPDSAAWDRLDTVIRLDAAKSPK